MYITMPSSFLLFLKIEVILPNMCEALDLTLVPPQRISWGVSLSLEEIIEHLLPFHHKLCGQQSQVDASRSAGEISRDWLICSLLCLPSPAPLLFSSSLTFSANDPQVQSMQSSSYSQTKAMHLSSHSGVLPACPGISNHHPQVVSQLPLL